MRMHYSICTSGTVSAVPLLMPKQNSIPVILALYAPTLTKVSCVWYNKCADRGRWKIEY